MNRQALSELTATVATALEQYDRENALAPDRHPIYCDCGVCEVVKAAREMVRIVEVLARAE